MDTLKMADELNAEVLRLRADRNSLFVALAGLIAYVEDMAEQKHLTRLAPDKRIGAARNAIRDCYSIE
jgi:hypothetical protein